MDHQQLSLSNSESVQIVVRVGILACRLTPAGSWLCCAEEAAPVCGHGLTMEAAVKRLAEEGSYSAALGGRS